MVNDPEFLERINQAAGNHFKHIQQNELHSVGIC